MPLLGTGNTVHPKRTLEATGVTTCLWLIKFMEGVGAQDPCLHFSRLFLWMKEKKPCFSGCKFSSDAAKLLSFARPIFNALCALATVWNSCAPVREVAPVLRGEEVLELWTPAEGAGAV
jgi:hypothetical protein